MNKFDKHVLRYIIYKRQSNSRGYLFTLDFFILLKIIIGMIQKKRVRKCVCGEEGALKEGALQSRPFSILTESSKYLLFELTKSEHL